MQSPFPKNVREMAWRVQRMSALEATFGKDGENIIITELDTMYKVGLDWKFYKIALINFLLNKSRKF